MARVHSMTDQQLALMNANAYRHVCVQAMNASPFVKPFLERSAAHEKTLQTLQDLLDSWLQARCLP